MKNRSSDYVVGLLYDYLSPLLLVGWEHHLVVGWGQKSRNIFSHPLAESPAEQCMERLALCGKKKVFAYKYNQKHSTDARRNEDTLHTLRGDKRKYGKYGTT